MIGDRAQCATIPPVITITLTLNATTVTRATSITTAATATTTRFYDRYDYRYSQNYYQ